MAIKNSGYLSKYSITVLIQNIMSRTQVISALEKKQNEKYFHFKIG